MHSLFAEIVKTFRFFDILFYIFNKNTVYFLDEIQCDGADSGNNNPTKPHSNTRTLVKTDHFTLKWIFFRLKLKENTLLQHKSAGVHRKSTKRGSTKKNVELLSKTQILKA